MYSKQAMQAKQQQEEYGRLVDQYSDLVARIAHHLAGRLPSNVLIDDLIQAGMIGLFEASKNFDQSKGASFETFAGIRIRGAMLDEIRKGEWAPRSVHKNNRAIAQTIHDLEQELGRPVFDREIAASLNVDIDHYHRMLRDGLGVKLFSLNEVLFDDGESTSERLANSDASPADLVENAAFKEQLVSAIEELPEKEKLVLSLYYEQEFNLREIGEVIGVSESRVSQLHGQAALRLRARLKAWIQHRAETP